MTVVLAVEAVNKAGLLTPDVHERAKRRVKHHWYLVTRLNELTGDGYAYPEDSIDHVFLIGNATRTPAIREAIEELFGSWRVSQSSEPSHMIARGAAIVADRI